jgi:cyclopropane-fatty-acyl-phospholipid synthase
MNAVVKSNVTQTTHASTVSAGARFLRQRLLAQMAGLQQGRLVLTDALGKIELGTPANQPTDIVVHLDVLDTGFYRAVAANGSVGAGELIWTACGAATTWSG